MAVFYNREKGKHGSLTGTIISVPVEIASDDPSEDVAKFQFPPGYLRCDGRVLSATEFPLLAEVLGTGDECKFRKPNQNLNSTQFQLPDLRNKHIRATTSANIGTYNDLEVTDSSGNQVSKSGVGLDVILNVDSPFQLTYNGSFYIPPQTVPLRGEPAFSIDSGSYTFETEVQENMFQPHLHRSTTARARQTDVNGNYFSPRQTNSDRVKSSLDVCSWWANTRQELCYWQITTAAAVSNPGRTENSTSYYEQYGLCWSACAGFTTAGYCLWPSTNICPNVNNQRWNVIEDVDNDCNTLVGGPEGDNTTFGNITYEPTFTQECVCTLEILGQCPGALNGGSLDNNQNSSQLTNYTEKNLSFTSFDDENYPTGYAAVNNITTLTGLNGDEGIHRHRLNFSADVPQSFVMYTRASTARADTGIVSTISISTNNEPKADKYIQPYIITEYLIKI